MNLRVVFHAVGLLLLFVGVSMIVPLAVSLLYGGEDAVASLNKVVGELTTEPRGDTISGTFGDLVPSPSGTVYFEPAVLSASDWETARAQLPIFAERAATDRVERALAALGELSKADVGAILGALYGE